MIKQKLYEFQYHSDSLSNFQFLVTGGAGFIGSNIVEYLLKYGAKKVRVLDNLSTGFVENMREFIGYNNFEFIEGDIRSLEACQQAVADIDYVLHQAALGSVPRSIDDPITTNSVNISGFLNLLLASKESNVKRFVYAASSSTYGDSPILPKREDVIGKPLSPYAVTKYVNELYADVFSNIYGIQTIGLRYFNVFGPRQRSNGPYAAVIPLFLDAYSKNKAPIIFGDGNQSRDFTFVENVVQANILSLFVANPLAINQIYNIAGGQNITLNSLATLISNLFIGEELKPNYQNPRKGDVRDSLADISKANRLLGYSPNYSLEKGLEIMYNIIMNPSI